jgi:hypothetical protein
LLKGFTEKPWSASGHFIIDLLGSLPGTSFRAHDALAEVFANEKSKPLLKRKAFGALKQIGKKAPLDPEVISHLVRSVDGTELEPEVLAYLEHLSGRAPEKPKRGRSERKQQSVFELFSSFAKTDEEMKRANPKSFAFIEFSPEARITAPFQMQLTPVTNYQFAEYLRDTGKDSSRLRELQDKDPNVPVVHVTYYEAAAYTKWLSDKDRERGFEYRLPTEDEWEHAAASIPAKYFYAYAEYDDDLAKSVWYRDNSGGKLHPVATLEPSRFGLYDMAGNVRVWVSDSRALTAVVKGASFQTSPVDRALRSVKHWHYHDKNAAYDDVGFRVVRVVRKP